MGQYVCYRTAKAGLLRSYGTLSRQTQGARL